MGNYSLDPIRFDTVSHTTLTRGPNDSDIGQVIIEDGKEYIKVYNNGLTLTQYDAAVAATTNTSPYSVTGSGATEAGLLVGIANNCDIASYHYGWLLKEGATDCKNGMSDTVHVSHEFAIPGLDGGVVAYTATAKVSPNITVISAGASGSTADSLVRVFIRA